MAEEEVVAAASPAPSDHKRKLEDLEPAAPEPPTADSDANPNSVSESYSVKKTEEEIVTGGDSDGSEAKRPRLEDKPDDLATLNGYQEEKADEPKEEVGGQPQAENSALPEDAQQLAEEASETGNNEKPTVDYHQTGDIQQPLVENPQLENPQEEISKVEFEEPPQELQEPPVEVVPQQGDVSSAEQQSTSEDQPMSRRMEVPNTKVGVLIGKAGDTIRYLQYSSGAKIQIMRDADADPDAATRPVELLGTLESINKAEKLINDVIAEADAGGSPSLVARGFSTVQSPGAKEQIEIQVPNEKVGSIIGKGGETIKNLQTRSGARIQLIPQHLPEGDQSKERTVRVTGDKKQIEVAREMIKEVMNQPPIRRSPLSSGYNQQAYRPRGPAASQWGPRGPHSAQPIGYDYPQRGPYPSHNPQYPPPSYGNYPAQQMAPRSNFGWDQRPQATMQAPPPQGGYDYYGGQGGHTANTAPSNPTHTHVPGPSPAHAMGPPPSQANYNYGQQQGPDYGQPTPYTQTAPPAQSYGHGYNETKYENQAPQQHQYGGHGGPQPSTYPQGYGQQEQYGKPPPAYGVPPQGSHAPSYGQPRANQPGDMPYQGPITSTQPYGPNAAAQQPYPYASSGPTQQTYPPYGSAPATDGYSHQPPTAASTPGGYPQQAGQPVSGYVQPGGQQGPGYAQVGPTQSYVQYPSSQPGYTEQAVPNNAGYGYQGPTDPAYGSGPGSAYGATTGQQAYSQPAPTQPGYDQSTPQPGAYGSVPGNVPVGYGKSLSPQPGYAHYDASQMYGAQR